MDDTDTTTVAMRPCCLNARERHGASAPKFGEAIGHLFEDDAAVEPIIVETRRSTFAARHEVGHAIVTAVLGGEVGRVTILGQALAECRVPADAPWPHRVAVDLAGDAATVGDLPANELDWHVTAVRAVGGGMCDRCRAVRSIVVGLRHPPNEDVIAEFRRIETILAEFFARSEVRSLVSDIAWDLFDEGTITGEYIEDHFGPRVRELKLEI